MPEDGVLEPDTVYTAVSWLRDNVNGAETPPAASRAFPAASTTRILNRTPAWFGTWGSFQVAVKGLVVSVPMWSITPPAPGFFLFR